MADDTDRGDIAADLDSVPVTLVFELGRMQLALGELRSLAAGYSFDLGKDLRAPVDILANGRKIGSGELIRALMPHDLIDVFLLQIHPVVLGSGRRMFDDGAPRADLKLTDSVVTTTGVVIATYERAR